MNKAKKLFDILGICILSIAVIAMVAFPACETTEDEITPPAEQEEEEEEEEELPPIKIGGTFELNMTHGQATYRGAQLAVDEINAAGGINGRQIEFIYYNNEADTETATHNCERLITMDGVVAITGAGLSHIGLAANEVVKQYHVPFIGNTPSTDDLDYQEWLFRPTGNATANVKTCLLALQRLGIEKVGLMYVNTAWGMNARDSFEEYHSEYGITVTGMEGVDVGTTDLTPQLTVLRDAGTEAIFWACYEKELIVGFTNVKAMGWDVKMLDEGGVTWGLIGSEAVDPRIMEGLYMKSYTELGKPLAQHVFDLYEDTYGERLELDYVTIGYDGIKIIAEAIRLAEDPDDPTSVRDALSLVDIPLAFGTEGLTCSWSILQGGQLPEHFAFYQIRGGELYPLEY